MSARKMFYVSSLLMLPLLLMVYYLAHISPQGHAIEQWLPKWDRLAIIATIILLERIYTYRYAVSQRAVLGRDIISNIVNLYVTGAVTAFLILPLLLYVPQHFFGRK